MTKRKHELNLPKFRFGTSGKTTSTTSADDEDAIDERALFGGGRGRENVTIADRNLWLEELIGDPRIRPWILACEAMDNGNPAPLRELSWEEIPAEALPFVEDLRERLARKGKPGKPRTPLYDRSPADKILALACEEVKHLVRQGLKAKDGRKAKDGSQRKKGLVDKACEQVAKDNPNFPSAATIQNAYEGSRTSTSKLRRRAKPE
jgi:hypothetical protein